MTFAVSSCLNYLDAGVAGCLLPAALAVLVSGLDDLALNAVGLWAWLRRRTPQSSPIRTTEQPIAIFVPLWHEHAVIAGMVEHNVSAIAYENYHFFIGAYPNDDSTLDAVRDLEARYSHVHLAICPHDGPTSKADCLNWIYQRMLLYEEQHNTRFEIVITHDAEDLIHPDALSRINAHSRDFDMVQIPVLPLPTPVHEMVHGTYCDEFAEWQIRDMPARQSLGSFVPSNGVGTGYKRSALEQLASADHNLIFDPACLTEDYENGLRLFHLGCRQLFVPVSRQAGGIVATREFFPRTMHSAIRQRTRWIMGIGLQSWQRYGWRGNLAQVYWFWRDRKGLFGNPLSLFTNLLFAYGCSTWLYSKLSGLHWGLAQANLHSRLLLCTLLLQLFQTSARMICCSRIYGPVFALGVPLRTVCGNFINSIATFKALWEYARARIRREPLVWLKTEHAYPTRTALLDHKRKLGEILVGSGYLQPQELTRALETQPAGRRLGEHLVRLRRISEEDLYEALSLQQGLPAGRLEPRAISKNVARALPRHIVRDWHVLPFRVASGNLFLASPEIPTDELSRAVHNFTALSLRFHLVTRANFDELTGALL